MYKLLVFIGFLQAFIAEGQSLVITSPASGSTLNACSYTNVQWTTGGTLSSVDVLYSLDNGINWTSAVSYLSNAGNYQLQIPSGAKSGGFAILVRNAGSNSVTSSVSGISINPTGYSALNVTSSQNFSYKPGDYFGINWNSSQTTCVKNVKIELSTNGGVNFPVTFSGNSSNSGSYYTYSLPNVNTSNAVVRISDVYNPSNFALSSTFEIKGGTAPSFVVLSPVANEVIKGCSNYTVKIKGNVQSYFNVDYSTDNGANWINSGSIYGDGTNTQTFSVSSVTGVYKIRFVSQVNSAITFPGNNFSVVASAPSIKLTSPSANSVYNPGSGNYVYWDVSPSCVQKSNLSFSSDEGNTWNTIATNVYNNNGSNNYYYWVVPVSLSGSNLIRVADAANPANSSTSVFYVPSASLTVLGIASPQGTACSSNSIQVRWNASGVSSSYYNLAYSTNGGSSWNIIQNSVYGSTGSNPKTYNWTPPATVSGSVLVSVVEPNTSLAGISNSFVITTPSNPTVSISSPFTNYNICSSVYFKWSGNGVCNFNLYVTTNNGASLIPVASNIVGSGSPYYWDAPASLSGISLKAVISDATRPTVSILGNSFTVINNASFVSVTPTNGSYNAGSAISVSWTSALTCVVANAAIELSTNGGANFLPAIVTTPNNGAYSYTLPFINTTITNAKIKISDPLNVTNSFVGGNFTILPAIAIASVTISSSVNACSNYSLSFIRTTNAYYDRFSIDLSTDNGVSWKNIADGQYAYSSSFNVSYSVSLPTITTSTAKLRVWYKDYPYVSAVSNTFSILPGTASITSVYPTSVTTYQAGYTQYLYYSASSSCIPKLKIEYSLDGGTNYTTLADNYQNNGYFAWNIPNTATVNGRIKISDPNSTVNGVSQPFSIAVAPSVLTVTSVGSPVQACSGIDVSWRYIDNNSYNFDFYYSNDNGVSWNRFITNRSVYGSPVYTTNVSLPNTASATNYKIKIVPSDNATSEGVSNSFLVNPALASAIKITSPVTDGFYGNAVANNIQWNTTAPGCVTEAKVEYSIDGGTSWKLINSNYPITDLSTSVAWYVPNNLTTPIAKVRISDAANPATVNDISGTFAIGSPFIIVSTPGAGQFVTRNTAAPVNYVYGGLNGSEYYYLLYTQDNGSTWTYYAGLGYLSGSGTASYSWMSPNVSVVTTVQIAIANNSNFASATKQYTGPSFIVSPPVTNTITVTGFSATGPCQGRIINVSFAGTGSYNAGNIFTAEIGSMGASVGSQTKIGSLSSTSTSGSFTITLPSGFSGSYGVRIYPSTPFISNTSQLIYKVISIAGSSCITANGNSALSAGKYCMGDGYEIDLSIQSNQVFSAGNTFTIQLSDQFGSFTNPVNIGQTTAISVPGAGLAIHGILPSTIPGSGTSFKLRVVSSNFSSVSSLADATLNIQAGCIYVNSVLGTSLLCSGAPVAIDFDAYTDDADFNFLSGNKFRVDLSNSSGTFYGNYIGEISDIVADVDKIVNATIPSSIATSANYKFNIVSTNPAATAVQVSSSYTIYNSCYNSVSIESLPYYFAGGSFKVYAAPYGQFKSGNVYVAELSDAGGSFASPLFLGSIAGTGAVTITGIIPSNIPQSSYYTVRVRSTNFPSTSYNTGYFTILPIGIFVPANITGSFCPGSPLNVGVVTVLGNVQAGNTYTLKLYDNYYGTTYNLYSVVSSVTGALPIPTIIIPASIAGYNYGYGYKLLVSSSNPSANSVNYSNTFYINSNCFSTAVPNSYTMRSGQPYTISYSVSASYPYTAANVFYAEISDALGNFTSPTVVGSVLATTSGIINITIPGNLPTGANYQFRIKSSGFVSYSNPSGSVNIQQVGIDLPQNLLRVYCPGSPFTLGAFTVTSAVNAGNVYTVQISTDNVNFYNLYSIASTSIGVVSVPVVYLPTTLSGGNYFIRVTTSAPFAFGKSNTFSVRYTCIDQPYLGTTFCPNTASAISIGSASFDAGNVFRLLLSDASGSFASPMVIGSATSTGASSVPISYTIPGFLPTGTNYKTKVAASDFAYESAESSPFTINQLCITAPNVTAYSTQCSFIPVVSVTGNGNANPGNVYKLILSSPYGSFSTGTTVLATLDASNGGALSFTNVVLPTVTGSNYLLRVEATDPVTIGSNTSNFYITNSCLATPYVNNSNYCAGTNIVLPVYIGSYNSYNAGNVFKIQLSDAAGNFGSPLTIYSATTTSANFNALATIPSGIASGSNYKIRITSSSPVFVSAASNSFNIDQVCLSVAPVVSSTPYIGNSSSISIVVQNVGAVSGGNTYTAKMYSYYYGSLIGTIGSSATNTITGTVPAVSNGGYYYVVVTSSNPVSTSVQSNYFNVSPNSIALQAIPGTAYCVGSSVTGITFTVAGTVGSSNSYYVDLSDANGNFYYTYNSIGSFADNTTGVKVTSVVLPVSISQSPYYKIRVRSSDGSISNDVSININATFYWTGSAGKTWNNVSNWSCPLIPTQDIDVIIPTIAGTNYPEIDVYALTRKLTVNSGSLLSIIDEGLLAVYGDLNVDGILTSTGAGAVRFDGYYNSSHNISGNGTITFGVVTVPSYNYVNINRVVNVVNNFYNYGYTYNYSTLGISGGFYNYSRFNTYNTLQVSGVFYNTYYFNVYNNYISSLYIYLNGGFENYSSYFNAGYSRFVFGGSTPYIGGNYVTNFYDIEVNNTTNLVLNTNMNIGGSFVNNGLFDGSSYQVRFVPGPGYLPNYILGGGVYNFNSIVFENTYNVFLNSSIRVKGDFVNIAGFNPGVNVVSFTGNGIQNITSTGVYNLTFNGIDISNIASDLNVNADLVVKGSFTNKGKFRSSNRILTFESNTSQLVGGTGQTIIGDLVNNNTDITTGVTLVGDIEVQGNIVNNGMFSGSDYTITTSGTTVQTISGTTDIVLGEVVNTNITGVEVTQDVQVTGSFSNKGRFRSATKAVTFSGSEAQVVTSEGETVLNDVVNINSVTGVSLSGNYEIAGDIVNNGTLDATSAVISTTGTDVQSISGINEVVLGDLVNTNTTGVEATQDVQVTGSFSNKGKFRSANKTVTLSGDTDQAIEGDGQTTLNNLVNNNVTGAVVVTSNLEVTGNIQNNGNLDASASVITTSGMATQTISGTNDLALGTIVNNNTVGGIELQTGSALAGDLVNNGSFVSSAPITFSGTSQTISGTVAPVLADVAINNTSNVILSKPLRVRGNLTNNSTNAGGLGTNGNTVSLEGTAKQVIGGATPTSFSGVALSNMAGVTATQPVSVSTISFTGGNLTVVTTTGPGTQPFTVTSTSPDAIMRTSGHVVGDVSRNVENASGSYLFPVGTAESYRGATVNFTSSASGTGSINVSHNDSKPVNPVGTTQPIPGGIYDATLSDSLKAVLPLSWTIKPTAGVSGGTYEVGFEVNVSIPGYTNVNDLRIVKRENPGDSWQLLGSNGTNSYDNGVLSISRTNLSGFSEFAVSGTCSNVSRISSRPTINTIAGSGDIESSLEGNNYQWSIDGVIQLLLNTKRVTPVISGKYRVKVVLSGCFTDASDELEVTLNPTSVDKGTDFGNTKVAIYPNPATKSFTFEISNAAKDKYVVSLYDLVGKQITARNYSLDATSTFIDSVDVSVLESGIYFVKIAVGNEIKVVKLIIEK